MESSVIFRGLTSSYSVGLTTLGVGLIIDIAGIATPEWFKASDGVNTLSWGLWRLCLNDICGDVPDSYKTDVLKVCEAFAILGVLASGTAFILGAIFVFLPSMGRARNKGFTDAAFTFGLAGTTFIIICVSVWGAKVSQKVLDPHLSYSFYLCVASLFLVTVGSLVVFAQGRRSERSSYAPIP